MPTHIDQTLTGRLLTDFRDFVNQLLEYFSVTAYTSCVCPNSFGKYE